jgi:hypothetical protein
MKIKLNKPPKKYKHSLGGFISAPFGNPIS